MKKNYNRILSLLMAMAMAVMIIQMPIQKVYAHGDGEECSDFIAYIDKSNIQSEYSKPNGTDKITIPLNVVITDGIGGPLGPEDVVTVAWQLDPLDTSGANIRKISNNQAELTLNNQVRGGSFAAKAIFTHNGIEEGFSVAIINIVDPLVPTSIDIIGENIIDIPISSNSTIVNYSGVVKDQYGAKMNSETISWTISEGNLAGVTFNSSIGQIIVNSNANPTTFTLVATSSTDGSVKGTKTVTIREPSLLTSIEVTGTQQITIPQGTIPTKVIYTAIIKDQNGDRLSNENVAYSLLGGTLNGITLNTNTGELTINNTASNGHITIVATSLSNGSINGNITVELRKVSNDLTKPIITNVKKIKGNKISVEWTYPTEKVDEITGFKISTKGGSNNSYLGQSNNAIPKNTRQIELDIINILKNTDYSTPISIELNAYHYEKGDSLIEVHNTNVVADKLAISPNSFTIDISNPTFTLSTFKDSLGNNITSSNRIVSSIYKANNPSKTLYVNTSSDHKIYTILKSQNNSLAPIDAGEYILTIIETDKNEFVKIPLTITDIEGTNNQIEDVVSSISIIGAGTADKDGYTSILTDKSGNATRNIEVIVVNQNEKEMNNETVSMNIKENVSNITLSKKQGNTYTLDIKGITQPRTITLVGVSTSNNSVKTELPINIYPYNETAKLVERVTVRGINGRTIINTDGGNLQLYADISPQDATNKQVEWSIKSGLSYAYITSNGLLISRGDSLSNGVVVVRATAKDGSGKYGEMSVLISNQVSGNGNTGSNTGSDTNLNYDYYYGQIDYSGSDKIREGTEDISDDSIIRTKSNKDGTKQTEATINVYSIDKALKVKDIKEIMVEITENSHEKIATLTAEAFQKMTKENVSFAIKTREVRLSIPSGIVDVEKLANQLGTNTKNVAISIKVKTLDYDTVKDIVEDTNRNDKDAKPITKILEFTIEATANGKTVTIDHFGNKVVKGEFRYSEFDVLEVYDLDKMNVYKYDESNMTWVYRRSRVDKDTNNVVFYTNTFSKYTIIERDITFTDIYRHWSRPTVELIASKNIISGYGDGTFRPDNKISRAEFTTMLVRALGLGEVDVRRHTFNDVSLTNWSNQYVSIANTVGLFNGIVRENPNKFNPNEHINREEMATMIMNAYTIMTRKDYKDIRVKSSFSDHGKVSTWAKQAVGVAKDMGIVSGVGLDTFAPKNSATRGEAATIMINLLNQVD